MTGIVKAALPLLKVGYAAYLGLNPPNDATGHAIAIYRPTEGSYFLFDPNFGVFGFKRSDIAKATLQLFTVIYPEILGDPFENGDGQMNADFTIFKKKG